MIPVNVYNLNITVTGYTNTWIIEATEEEIEKLANQIRKSIVYPTVEYSINNNFDVEVTHFIDSDGYIWAKTGIELEKNN